MLLRSCPEVVTPKERRVRQQLKASPRQWQPSKKRTPRHANGRCMTGEKRPLHTAKTHPPRGQAMSRA
jgi:hypothetical protein